MNTICGSVLVYSQVYKSFEIISTECVMEKTRGGYRCTKAWKEILDASVRENLGEDKVKMSYNELCC
jgi:hypothetical protein